MKKSGYLFPETEEIFTSFLLEGVNSPENYLQSGGNIFVFPEGTRSLDGKLGRLKKGAFSLARQCRAPIEVLTIKNTNQLFRPGKWLFNTCLSYKIEVKKIKSLQPDYISETFSLQALIEEVRQTLEKELES